MEVFLFLINVIVGAGIFLNTVPIFNLLGSVSWLAYLLTGLLIIPVVYVTYSLSCLYAGYNMIDLLAVSFGERSFFYAMMFALGKVGTSAIGLICMTKLLMEWIGAPFCIAFFSIFIFLFLLLHIGFHINKIFMFLILVLKLSIVLFVIGIFLYVWNREICILSDNLVMLKNGFSLQSLGQAVSITVFAFSGFEALFSVTNLLANKKSGAFILGCSFVCALLLYLFYQYSISYILTLCNMHGYEGSFIELMIYLGRCTVGGVKMPIYFMHYIEFALMMAFCGVSYGLLYANSNNIYAILNKMRSFSFLQARLLLFFCLFLYVLVGSFNILYLQQFSTLATLFLYALFLYQFIEKIGVSCMSILGCLSLSIFILMHIYNAFVYLGFYGYMMYGILSGIVFCLYNYLKRSSCSE